MEAYKTEEEQVEAIKKWWKENASHVIVGVCVVLIAIGGWRYWQGQQHSSSIHASTLLDLAVDGLSDNNDQQVSDAAGQVLSEFSDTGYSPFAALTLAKSKHAAGDFVSAQTYLQWALDNTDDDALQHVARVRLAAVLWEQDKADEALQLINGVDQGKFVASYEDLRGDILASQGKASEAIKAYEIAMSDESFADPESIKLKISALKSSAE